MLSAFRSRTLRKSLHCPTRKLRVVPLELRCTPATINGQMFYDVNANGAIDAGDTGLSGVTVFLDANNNGVLDETIKTYTSSNVPIAIPDLTTITSTLTVADTGTIADINVKLSINHTWAADLDIFITGPTGTKITLSTDNGGNSDNYTNTVFDDEAAVTVVGSAAPFTGSFKPEGALSGLDTKAINGTWTLTVTDDGTDDIGTLTAWSLEITTGGETAQDTNAIGNYSFTGLTAGSYNVAHVLPSGGYLQTTPGGDGRHHVTLAAPDTFVGNFGDRLPPATISGLVFNDVNGNGKNDSEAPLSGVTVYLDLDNSGTFNAGDTSIVTAADGKYTFNDLVPNKDYIVAEVLPGGFTHIAPIRNGLVASANINVNKQSGDQSETSVAIDPGNPNRVFSSSNQLGATGMMGSVSVDGGSTWTARNFGIGSDGYATSIGDPVHHFDKFGNLWGAQLASSGVATVVGRSTDGGKSFTTFYTTSASTDQPTIVTGNSSTAGRALVALVYNQGGAQLVSYLEVDAAGPIGTFSAPVTVLGSNSGIAGNFGDICIGPNGQVAVTYVNASSGQGPDSVFFNLDADGIGPGAFAARTTITSTNVGGFDFIPAQPDRSVDAEPDLVWDASGGPFHGRLYLTYTEETAAENSNLEIMMRFSDNNGGSWSAAKRVNDDSTTRSQFLPRSSIDQTTGHIAFSWYDCRNDAANTLAEYWATASFDGGATFQPNIKLSTGKSTAVSGNGNDYGDYSDLSFTNGRFIGIWADNSNSTGNNPGPNSTSMDIYIAKVTVANNQPNFQITTAPGITYANNDFAIQGAVAPPAKISSTQINDGSVHRSRITSLQVTFDSAVTLPVNPADAFQLMRQSDNAFIDLIATPSGNAVTLTFAAGPAVDFTSLADGRYTLTALANQINAGNFDGDGNGVAGDNYVLASAATPNPATNIFRFFGDFDGDGNVAANDFIQFRLALGGTNPIFDFDNDGAVAASDFIQFRLRFGGSI